MLGKQKCRILKEIRQRIADENHIPYVTRECRYQGECAGTCPRCESELRYLEQQLSLRASLGKRVTVAALCAGMALAAAGCAPARQAAKPDGGSELSGAISYEEPTPSPEPSVFVTTGEVYYPEDPEDGQQPEDAQLPPEETAPIEEIELMGDVAYIPEAEGNG